MSAFFICRDRDSLRVNTSVEESTLEGLGAVTQSHGAFSIIVRIDASPLSHLVTFGDLVRQQLLCPETIDIRLWPLTHNLRWRRRCGSADHGGYIAIHQSLSKGLVWDVRSRSMIQ
jgi:hypothetical protein